MKRITNDSLSIFPIFAVLMLVVSQAAFSDVEAAIVSLDDFGHRSTLIDFSTVGPDEEITTQFQSLGVTFSGGWFGDPFPESSLLGSKGAVNFKRFVGFFNPLFIDFTNPQQRVGMFLGGGPAVPVSFSLSGLLNGDLVAMAEFTAVDIMPPGTLRSVFGGLSNDSGIDRVIISGLPNSAYA